MIYHISSNKRQVFKKCYPLTRVKPPSNKCYTSGHEHVGIKKGESLASGHAFWGRGQSSWKILNV